MSEFIALYPRDARMIRAPGVFRFVRREESGEAVVLHEERADLVAARAGPGHPRWRAALLQGMNEVQVRLERPPPDAPQDR